MSPAGDAAEDFAAVVLGVPALAPPGLGATRRDGAAAVADVRERLNAFHGAHAGIARDPAREAIALLWHDHLDAAHVLVQDLETRIGMHLHGIMHRREGDFGNAKYWFRRAGHLAVLDGMVPLANAAGAAFLVQRGRWDADAFVDACAAGEVKFVALQAAELRILAGALG